MAKQLSFFIFSAQMSHWFRYISSFFGMVTLAFFYSIYLWMVSICGCRQNVFSILDNFHQARIALLDWMHRLSLQIFTYLWLNIFFMDFFLFRRLLLSSFFVSLCTHIACICAFNKRSVFQYFTHLTCNQITFFILNANK